MKIGPLRKRQSSISGIVHIVIMGRESMPIQALVMAAGTVPLQLSLLQKKLPKKQEDRFGLVEYVFLAESQMSEVCRNLEIAAN